MNGALNSAPHSSDDPRIYFASERTLLAWIRTGIAIIGLGFVVARFGLFLSILGNPRGEHPTVTGSTIIGTSFVLIGAVVMLVATLQHARFCRELGHDQIPSRYWTSFSIWVSSALAGLGGALAVYLIYSMLK